MEARRRAAGAHPAQLERAPFSFGERPTLADAALYGNMAVLFQADPALPRVLGPALEQLRERLEEVAAGAGEPRLSASADPR